MNFSDALDTLSQLSHITLIKLGTWQITLWSLASLVFMLALAWWFALLLERAVQGLASRSARLRDAAPAVYAWARVLRYLIWIFATLIGLKFIGIDLGNLALIAGAIGLGIGFGLQNIVNNLVSGIILLLEKTLKQGDFVDLQSGVRGHVREIGLRYTRVTTNDGVDIIVPNSEFINGRVMNWTFDNRLRRTRIEFSVAYGSDKQRVREAALAAAKAVNITFEDGSHQTDVWLVRMADSALTFELAVWVGADGVSRPAITQAKYLWAIHDQLLAYDIEIPFPQRDLHVRSGSLDVRLTQAQNENVPTRP